MENCPTVSTPEEALRVAEECKASLEQRGQLTVHEAIVRYQDYQRDVKGNREGSIRTTGHTLCRFFEPALEMSLGALTTARGEDLYAALRSKLAVDTHRNYLAQAKSLCRYAVKQGWLSKNPLEKIEGHGRRRRGKLQLRIDEGRKLYALCVRVAPIDDGAVALLLAMLCALRASEIVSRTVRDLDGNGTILWIEETERGFETKTAASRRRIEIPPELQAPLLARCKDKLPGALLFQAANGGAHWRDWVKEETHRLCAEAQVPIVCAHSLRGFHATVAVRSGMSPKLVSETLGHTSPSMTLSNYAAPGSEQEAQKAAAVTALRAANSKKDH